MLELAIPRVSFLIGGVQKAGTTALTEFLRLHPRVVLPKAKEAHVFDAPDFDDAWGVADVDQRYVAHFDSSTADVLCGDATPIYCLHERFVERIARYNPGMRWILLLRDPVERAISQYHMERERGNETWSLLPALLLERWRLRGHADDFSEESPLRTHSYRLRGDYARQLDVLYRYFPLSQVLVLLSTDLRDNSHNSMQQVYSHLGLAGPVLLPKGTRVFVGNYASPTAATLTRRMAEWLLRPRLQRLRDRYGIDFGRRG